MNKSNYLQKIFILFKKEFFGYFNSPIAYIFIAVFLIAGNWLFFNSFFLVGQASMRGYFSLLPWFFLFLTPAVTMRLWSEEKKSGTIEFLLTLPITDWQVILGKFFGALAFIVIVLTLTLTLPVSVAFLGDFDWGAVIGAYLGAIFLGGAYLSLGLFISSLTKNQIVAFVLTLSIAFIFFIIGSGFVVEGAPEFIQGFLSSVGIGSHFNNIAKGILDSRDIIYYCSFIFLFLWLNAKIIEKRG